MYEIKKLFRELYYEVFKIVLIHSIADALIVFLILLNITALFRVRFYYALVISLVMLLIDIILRMRHVKLKKIEQKNPQINEILRTARDNYNGEDFMVRAMFEELIAKMKSVSAGSIAESKVLFFKLVAVCILSFAVIIISASNIHVPKEVFDVDNYYKFFARQKESLNFYGIEFNNTDADIYGASHLSKLGNKEIELRVTPGINKISFENIKDPEEKEFEKGTFPKEIYAVSDSPNEEKAPKEAKLAIDYNLRLKNIKK